MATYGKPTKANGARRDTPAGPVRGRTIAQRVRAVALPVRDAEPIGTAMMASLGLVQLTGSPASSGGGFVTNNVGAGIVGRDSRRTGALQSWSGAGAPVARTKGRAKVGVQAGPSSQPAFPSTGTTQAPGLTSSLAWMALPQVLTNPAVR